jgi:hypothetical protein
MLSIALAVAYSITRTQSVQIRLQSNTNLQAGAQQVALSGMAAGMRSMNESTWGGITSTVSGTLGAAQSFTVSYQTGDPNLSSSDPDWPYRVTLVSTGTAVDPAHPTVTASHRILAVVHLLPRQLANEPASWATMLQYTVYQYTAASFDIELPGRVVGPVYVQGQLTVGKDYPPATSGQSQYAGDINAMQFWGLGDNRPLTNTVYTPATGLLGWLLSLLNLLNVNTVNITPATVAGWNYPGAISSYQLYTGGQTYTVPTVSSTLSNTTLAASPSTNPLGIFYASGNVTINSNVTINGTLVSGGDVTINGTGVSMQPVALPQLQGGTGTVQLPVAVVKGNVSVGNLAQASVRGLVAAWNSFNILQGSQLTSFNLQGRVICKGFLIDDRTEWKMNGGQWNSTWTQFNNQSWPFVWFYPQWLQQQQGLNYTPTLTVAPETSPVTYHWKDTTSPVYVPNSADPGLRWTLQRWTDDY